MFVMIFGVPGIRGPQLQSRMNWLVGLLGGGGVLACPIMLWITPSSPRQLLNCYPPFCGAKPNCVERDGRGAHWNPLAWVVFSPLRPECWHGHNFTHTQVYTHSHKVPAKGFERAMEGNGRNTWKRQYTGFYFSDSEYLHIFEVLCRCKCKNRSVCECAALESVRLRSSWEWWQDIQHVPQTGLSREQRSPTRILQHIVHHGQVLLFTFNVTYLSVIYSEF